MDIASFQTQLGDGPLTTGSVASAMQKVMDRQAAAKAVPTAPNPLKSTPALVPATPTPAATTPAVTTETTPVIAKTPEELEKEKVTERFGALARMEQQNVRERQAIGKEKQTIALEKARLEGLSTEFTSLKSKVSEDEALWKVNPLEALKRRGYNYDQITQLQLNDGRPTPEMVAKKTVEEVLAEERKKTEAAKEVEKEKLTAVEKERFEQVLANFKQEVQDFYTASENTDAYELINLHDAGEVVVATIEEHFQRTKKAGKPQIMGIKQACDLVEKYLEERIEKSTQTKKWVSRATPAPADAATQQNGEAKPNPINVQPRTITNNLTSSAQGSRPLSRDERIKRAMAVQVVPLPK